MFKRSHLASAVILAMASQLAYAQQEDNNQENQAEKPVEVIEVSGIRGSLNKALNLKRQNLQIVDAIVAEDIGKFPDNNVVEALQRVTGIQVTDRGQGEVSTVSIRGLTDVTTTVNGRNIFTASGRAVALADVPAALLETVEVFKTRAASQIGSGIAGQINIETQRPFNFEGEKVVVAARGIHQEQADKTDPSVSALLSNRWDTGHGEFGALVNVSYTRTSYRDQSITPGAMVPFMTNNPAEGFGQLERIFLDDARVSESPIWQAGLEQGLPYQAGSTLDINGVPTEYYLSRDAIFASDLTGERERPAANISFQWAPNDRSEYLFEAFYNGYRNESFNSLLFNFTDAWGNVDDTNPPLLFEGTNIIKERYVDSPYAFNSGDLNVGQTDSYVFALGGNWIINDDLTLESEVIYQKSKFESEFFAMRTDRTAPGLYVDFNDNDGIPALEMMDNPDTEIDESDLTDPRIWNTAELYDNGNENEGDSLTFKIDGEYFVDKFGFERINFGARWDKREVSEADRLLTTTYRAPLSDFDPGLTHINSNFFDGEADFPDSWAVANGYYIYNNRSEIRNIYGYDNASDDLVIRKNFEIEETTSALYLQGDYAFQLGGKLVDGQVGLRWEDADRDMDFIPDDGETSSASGGSSTILPTFMVRFHLMDDLLARFAYTETIRRPNFVQLNSNIVYNEDVTNVGYGTATGGNPNLEPVESQNLDISLEYYFGEGNSIYATWFRRDIEGFVFDSLNVVRRDSPETGEEETYILSQPDNSSNGVLTGWELGAVYFPEGLPELLDGFGLQASATLLDSEQDLPNFGPEGEIESYSQRDMFGVSDTSYSVVAIYEKENFDMRLSYVWRDDFLNNYEAALFANPRGVYRRPEQSVDFQMSYDVNEHLTVTLDGTNLTEETYQSYYQYPYTHNFGNALYSRTFALGVRYTM